MSAHLGKIMRWVIPTVISAGIVAISACDTTDDDRIPAYPVQILLNNPGLWDTYGVSAFGQCRIFIRQSTTPDDFPFTESTYTGYGGVMLIMGMNPYSAGDVVPLAYDLACPVECKEYIRVQVDPTTFEAICPECGSHYDVTMSGGAPTAGPALTGSVKYALQRYNVFPSGGGYIIGR